MSRRAFLRGAFWGEASLAALGAVCFAVAFTSPILGRIARIGIADDWSEHLEPNWAAFYTISHFHQVPLWNPYRCGGMPLLAHPLSLCVSPLFLVQIIFGPFVGVNLQIPIHIGIGWIGGYVLGRCVGLGMLGSVACASIFPASSWFYLHIAVGHLEYLPAMYMPLTLAMVWRGAQRQRLLAWVVAGLLMAVTLGEGGVYQCTRVVIFASLLALYLAIAKRSLWPIWGMAVFGLFSIGFGAIKLLPCWYDVMRLHPRPISDLEYNRAQVLLTGILTRDQFWGTLCSGPADPQRQLGLFRMGRLLERGSRGVGFDRYPWALLHHLPLFSAERVPERCLMGVILAIGVMAGFGTEFLSLRLGLFGAIFASAVIAAAVVDAWIVNRPNLNAPAEASAPQTFGEALEGTRLSGLPRTVSASTQFRQFYGSPWEMVGTAESNMGALFCNEGMTDFYDVSRRRSVVGFNQAGYFGEQFLVHPGSLNLRRWTPNGLNYDVDTPADNLMVVNQVYDPNWRVVEGSGEVISAGGLIGVRLPPGRQHLHLAYRSHAFVAGVLITLLTSIAAIVIWRREA